MIVQERTLIRMSASLLISMASGLVVAGIVYASMNDKVATHDKELAEVKARIAGLEEFKTDIAVIKQRVTDIDKKLDRM